MPPKKPAASSAKEENPGTRRRVKAAAVCNRLTVRVSCRRSDRAQGASSVHDRHDEGGAERAGLPQGVFISGHSELHHREIPVGRCGETETMAPQSSEKGNREWRVGATRQLQSRHGRNGEVPGNVSEFRLSVLSVVLFNSNFCFCLASSWHRSSRSQSLSRRMLIRMSRKNLKKRMTQRSPPKQVC